MVTIDDNEAVAGPDRILVVDDDEYSRRYLVLLLGAAGYEIIEAGDGRAAVDMARKSSPDLVLLDIVMPVMDGYQAIAELKGDSSFSDVPVIFLSSKSETADKIKGLDLGGADYITKPFDEGEVLARVRSQLKIRGLTRELKRANEELRAKQVRLDEDLRAAGDIQRSMLPADLSEISLLSLAWKFVPSEQIGGDIFNVMDFGGDRFAFYLLDVSGHGPPSALVAVSVSNILHSESEYCLAGREGGSTETTAEPREVLTSLDRQFPIERFNRYFTMFYGLLDHGCSRLRYCSAAHPPALLLRASGGTETLEEGGSIVGLGGAVPFEQGEVPLHPGDRIVLYTDGVIEYENGSEEFYGRDRLMAALEEWREAPLEEIPERIYDSMMEFGGSRKPGDDVTIMVLEHTG